MVFIPDDILDTVIREAVKSDEVQQEVLLWYAMHSQNEGVPPDAARLAEELGEPLEDVEGILQRLDARGWLERVKDYSE